MKMKFGKISLIGKMRTNSLSDSLYLVEQLNLSNDKENQSKPFLGYTPKYLSLFISFMGYTHKYFLYLGSFTGYNPK